MSKSSRRARIGLAAAAGVALCVLPMTSAFADSDHGSNGHASKHVLLISVDGMHQSDLDWYVAKYPAQPWPN